MTPLTSFLHFDWTKIGEGILTSSGGAAALYFFGKRAQKWREKVDTRTQDQKNIDQLLGRVTTLEGQMSEANEKIEDLRTEKMELQAQIITLRQDIAVLEVKKAQFESRELIFNAQLADLQQRLDVKTAQLACAETRLHDMEKRDAQTKSDNARNDQSKDDQSKDAQGVAA